MRPLRVALCPPCKKPTVASRHPSRIYGSTTGFFLLPLCYPFVPPPPLTSPQVLTFPRLPFPSPSPPHISVILQVYPDPPPLFLVRLLELSSRLRLVPFRPLAGYCLALPFGTHGVRTP